MSFNFFRYPHTNLNQQNFSWIIDEMQQLREYLETYKNPELVKFSADFTDEDKIYIYQGTEPDHVYNGWYYYDTDTRTWTFGGYYGFDDSLLPLAVTDGGTGSRTAPDARAALGTDDASNLTKGTLHNDRLPVVPITKGGTGAANAPAALASLGVGDYVVETGEDGPWKYRKWASGYLEAYYHQLEASTDFPINTQTGSIYTSANFMVPLPSFGLSWDPPLVGVYHTVAYAWATYYTGEGNVIVRALSATSADSGTLRVSISITGRWK